MFKPTLFDATPRHAAIYGLYERLYTFFDTIAAGFFVVGSVMFFYPAWQESGTWLFLLGSLCFAARPTVRLLRKFHLASLPLPGDDAPAGNA